MTRTVKLNVPTAVGVPDMVPSVLSVRPSGKAPDKGTRLQLKGNVPPVATRLWLYAPVIVASGRLVV